MIASAAFEVAEIKAKEAEQEKIATILKAEGRKEAIELSGDITQLEQAIIDAEVEKAKVVSEALAKIQVPSTVIVSGGANGGSVTDQLINIRLMEGAGLFDKVRVSNSDVKRKVKRPSK